MAPAVAVVGLLEVFSATEELRSVLVPLHDADTYELRFGLYSLPWRFHGAFFSSRWSSSSSPLLPKSYEGWDQFVRPLMRHGPVLEPPRPLLGTDLFLVISIIRLVPARDVRQALPRLSLL